LEMVRDYLTDLKIFKELKINASTRGAHGNGWGPISFGVRNKEEDEDEECEMMIHDIISDLHLLKQQKQQDLEQQQEPQQQQQEEEQPIPSPEEVTEPNDSSPEENLSKIQYLEGKISTPLAITLSSLWSQTEHQFTQSSQQYFHLIREIKYQFLQRKSLIQQALYSELIVSDHRQEIYQQFQQEYNSYENDLRYDSDFTSEYLLRILELRSELSLQIENKMKNIINFIQIIFGENLNQVYIHRINCESVMLIQSYGHLFVTMINILQDCLRHISSAVNTMKEYEVCLEETLPAINPFVILNEMNGPSGGGKEKKGKEEKKVKKEAVAGRAPLVPLLFSPEEMLVLPEPTTDEAEDNTKGKKAEMKKKVSCSSLAY
jgi:hypothetical protein